jgi:S1-C subfamily serine protease
VLEVWNDTPADRAGILPGDVIASVDGGELQQLALPAAQPAFVVEILRTERRRTVSLETGVKPGDWNLAAAGLQPGDRILSVNGQPVSGDAALNRALSRLSKAFLVVQRGNRRFGVTLNR